MKWNMGHRLLTWKLNASRTHYNQFWWTSHVLLSVFQNFISVKKTGRIILICQLSGILQSLKGIRDRSLSPWSQPLGIYPCRFLSWKKIVRLRKILWMSGLGLELDQDWILGTVSVCFCPYQSVSVSSILATTV